MLSKPEMSEPSAFCRQKNYILYTEACVWCVFFFQLTINGLSRLFFMRKDLLSDEQYNLVVQRCSRAKKNPPKTNLNHHQMDCNGFETGSPMKDTNNDPFTYEYDTKGFALDDGSTSSLLVGEQLQEMRNSLSYIKTNMSRQTAYERQVKDIARQWRDVSLVLDRTFFLTYVIIIVISLITLFPRPK